ncbi:MAG: UPF0158 family protein [Prolixibacteraceae bacterium]|jgi:hypothetical protein|nr:UPF0158 family protein [Prolixibacteraceae bacterium]
MDKYIEQLIEDLELAAQNPPKQSYFESPPVFEDNPPMAELSSIPFKTIEELTGIKQEVFPIFDVLQYRHWTSVLEAIFKLFDSLFIKLIDVPKGIPKEYLYDIITTNWHQPVQYLPESGMDLELCIGDPIKCPYGDYCDCGHEWPDDEEHFELERKIPDIYEAYIPKIAKIIDEGMVCSLNTKTLELKTIPLSVYENPDKLDALTEDENEDGNLEINIFEKHFWVEPLLKYEIADMMEDFTNFLLNQALQEKLFKALNSKNWLEQFHAIISNSDEKQNWLNFKQTRLEEHARATIWQDIKFNNKYAEMNGLFNDDGSRIDPETVPTPSLCMTCKSFYTGDAEENILCILNRSDQKGEPDFKCYAYKSI